MDQKFLYTRIRYIMLSPGTAWKIIHSENRPIKYVRGSFFMPLIILVALAAILGSFLFTRSGLSYEYALIAGIKYFLLFFLLGYITSYVFSEITKAMGLRKDFVSSFKIVAYSMAPLLICQIMSRLFESLIFVNVLSLYGLYIFWVGIEEMINPSEDKKVKLLILTLVTVIAVFIVTNWGLSRLTDAVYFRFFG